MRNHSRTAKSARRTTLTLLAALLAVATASIVVFAMPSANSFEISASPANQTVAQGQTATYAVALDRGNSFESPVALAVMNLPANVDASFSRDPIPGSGSASTLTIATNVGGTTPTGTRTLTVRGTSGSIVQTTTVTLTVNQATQPGFNLTPTPSARTITTSDHADYTIVISRSGPFTGPVSLSASGLPAGATPSFAYPNSSSAAFTITTNDKVHPGTYPITVTGVGQHGATQITRSATVNMVVEEKKPFEIEGAVPEGLAPGAEIPMDLTLGNPHNFEIFVREVAVSLDPHSNTPTCGVKQNFGVEQIPSGRYPITLPPQSKLKLSELGVSEDDMPKAKMLNLSTNQDGCKGAQVYFQYTGLATKP